MTLFNSFCKKFYFIASTYKEILGGSMAFVKKKKVEWSLKK